MTEIEQEHLQLLCKQLEMATSYLRLPHVPEIHHIMRSPSTPKALLVGERRSWQLAVTSKLHVHVIWPAPPMWLEVSLQQEPDFAITISLQNLAWFATHHDLQADEAAFEQAIAWCGEQTMLMVEAGQQLLQSQEQAVQELTRLASLAALANLSDQDDLDVFASWSKTLQDAQKVYPHLRNELARQRRLARVMLLVLRAVGLEMDQAKSLLRRTGQQPIRVLAALQEIKKERAGTT